MAKGVRSVNVYVAGHGVPMLLSLRVTHTQNVKNTLADIDMPLDTFTTDEKFAQLHALPGNVFDNVALSGNMVLITSTY